MAIVIVYNTVGVWRTTPELHIDNYAFTFPGDCTSENGHCLFTVPDQAPQGRGASVLVNGVVRCRLIVPTAPGRYEANLPPVRPPEQAADITLVGDQLRRLAPSADGLVLCGADGTIVPIGGVSDFRLFHMYLEGESAVADRIAERAAVGANAVRVFGACDFLFQLDPRRYGSAYYIQLRDFAEKLANAGLYLHFTALTDCHRDGLRGLDQQQHLNLCADALADVPNVCVLEAANENVKNGIGPLSRPSASLSLLLSTGSWCDGWQPTGTWGNIVTFHPRRDWKWWFTVPGTAQEVRQYPGQRRPVLIGEPIGAGDPRQDSRRVADMQGFERLAAGIRYFTAGGHFHSVAGLRSTPWPEIERQCAEAFFRGFGR